jgi:hypothetical protein
MYGGPNLTWTPTGKCPVKISLLQGSKCKHYLFLHKPVFMLCFFFTEANKQKVKFDSKNIHCSEGVPVVYNTEYWIMNGKFCCYVHVSIRQTHPRHTITGSIIVYFIFKIDFSFQIIFIKGIFIVFLS